MTYLVHYSKNILDKCKSENPRVREIMSDHWKCQNVEAISEEDAVRKVLEKEGEDKVNYILSVTPV